MVYLQVNLTDKANKKLELYRAYTSKKTKAEAINQILEELDITMLREEYFKEG